VELEILAINFFLRVVGLLVPSGVLPHVTASFCGSSSDGEPVSVSSESRSPLVVNAFFLSRSWEGGDASRSRLESWVPDDIHLIYSFTRQIWGKQGDLQLRSNEGGIIAIIKTEGVGRHMQMKKALRKSSSIGFPQQPPKLCSGPRQFSQTHTSPKTLGFI
jgi:hypothetical protein